MRSGEDQYTNNEASVPRRSRAQSDAVWRRRRELDPNFSLCFSPFLSLSLRLTLLSANVTPEDHSVTHFFAILALCVSLRNDHTDETGRREKVREREK